MKKIIPILFAAVILIKNVYANSFDECFYDSDPWYNDVWCDEKGLYAQIFVGANFLQSEKDKGIKGKFDTGYLISGSVGYRGSYGVRFEVEYAFRRNTMKHIRFLDVNYPMHGHYQSSSYMGNLLWDLPVHVWGYNLWDLEPIVGVGVGYDIQRIHGENSGLSYHKKGKGFAWQLIAGLGYPIFCNTTLAVQYVFHKGSLSGLYNHSVGASLRYNF